MHWNPIDTAPHDGSHILVCCADKSFNELPPTVVHWWPLQGEEGFYTSVNELAPTKHYPATHWMHIPEKP